MMRDIQSGQRRSWQYDFLRVLAMVLVMLFHYTTQFSETVQETPFAVFFSKNVSSFALSMFFLMNGFFAYRSLKNDKISVWQYLKKRARRLLPTFWLCLIITTLVLRVTGTAEITVSQFLLNAVLLNRFVGIPFVDGVYWYLLIVLIFTAFITAAKCLKADRMRLWLFALYGIAFLGAGVFRLAFGAFPEILAFALFEYLNKCLIGVAIGWLHFEGKALSRRARLFGLLYISALLFGEFLWLGTPKVLSEMAGVALFTLVTVFGGCVQIGQKPEKLVSTMADESYFVYLIHQQIGFVLIKALIGFGVNCNLALLITMAIILLFAYLHHALKELFSHYSMRRRVRRS